MVYDIKFAASVGAVYVLTNSHDSIDHNFKSPFWFPDAITSASGLNAIDHASTKPVSIQRGFDNVLFIISYIFILPDWSQLIHILLIPDSSPDDIDNDCIPIFVDTLLVLIVDAWLIFNNEPLDLTFHNLTNIYLNYIILEMSIERKIYTLKIEVIINLPQPSIPAVTISSPFQSTDQIPSACTASTLISALILISII